MKTFRIIDFETTGLSQASGIVEIGYTDLIWEGSSMTVTTPKSFLTDPVKPIEVGAMAVHHITPTMLKGKPHPFDILDTLDKDVDFIAAHHLPFELQFYSTALPTICTLKCARALIQAPGYKNQELRYFLDLPLTQSLAEPPHRAGPDSYVTAFLLKHLLTVSAQQGGDFVGRLVGITNGSITTPPRLKTHIDFGKKHPGKTYSEVARIDPGYLHWIIGNERADPDNIASAKHALGLD